MIAIEQESHSHIYSDGLDNTVNDKEKARNLNKHENLTVLTFWSALQLERYV